MRRSTVIRVVTLIGCALLLSGVGAVVAASSAPVTPDFTLHANKSVLSLTNGNNARLSVKTKAVGGFHAPVTVSVSGVPSGVTVTTAPNPVSPPGPAVLTFTASQSVTSGNYPLTVTGTSGVLHDSVNVHLVISAPAAFTMTLTPSSQNVVDGSAGDYTLTVKRGPATGAIKLKLSGLPANTTGTIPASLAPTATTATVHITTTTNAVPGSYPITVTGTAALASQTATANLVIVPQTFANFPITGTLDRVLFMGTTARVNLAITDPFSSALTVTGLSVAVSATSNPACATSNFAVSQYSGAYPLTIPANTTKTLSQLGIATSTWPTVTLTDLPVNQDACKHVTLTLTYGGTGSGN